MKLLKILNIAVLCVAVLLILGLATVFAPCGAKEDGSFMDCHYACTSAQAATAVVAALALAALLVGRENNRRGFFLAMLPVEVFTVLLPGVIVSLCMMPGMRCRMLMRPFVIFMCILLFALTLALVFLAGRQRKKAQV